MRHGESEWNREHRWQGWIDIALTPLGEAQAVQRARLLAASGAGFAAVLASDLVRARRTAELMAAELAPGGLGAGGLGADGLGAGKVVADRAFRERCGGEWQGHTSDEIAAAWPEEFAAWRAGTLERPPGGETEAAVWHRFLHGLRARKASPPGDWLVVTHGGVSRLACRHAGVETLMPGNLGGWWFDFDGTQLTAREVLPPLPETTLSTAAE